MPSRTHIKTNFNQNIIHELVELLLTEEKKFIFEFKSDTIKGIAHSPYYFFFHL